MPHIRQTNTDKDYTDKIDRPLDKDRKKLQDSEATDTNRRLHKFAKEFNEVVSRLSGTKNPKTNKGVFRNAMLLL